METATKQVLRRYSINVFGSILSFMYNASFGGLAYSGLFRSQLVIEKRRIAIEVKSLDDAFSSSGKPPFSAVLRDATNRTAPCTSGNRRATLGMA